MRARFVDLALLVGLIAVSGGILWTLFTLGSGPRPTPATPPPAAATPAPAATSPGGASAGARGVVPVDPSTAPAPAAAGADAPAPGAAAPTPAAGGLATPAAGGLAAPAAGGLAAPAPDPAPTVPLAVGADGTIALERVGYSFVTGGAGACGVVLEAWVHVAVSRDLLAAYGCGAEVRVTLDDPADGRSEVVGVIGDTMNPSFTRTVNVYVGEDEDAFGYGLTTGTFAPR